jgi:hypothetical protein
MSNLEQDNLNMLYSCEATVAITITFVIVFDILFLAEYNSCSCLGEKCEAKSGTSCGDN